jgi:hypothetical protein
MRALAIVRATLVAVATGALMFSGTAAMAAAGPVTTVVHEHQGTDTFVDVGPECGSTELFEITVATTGWKIVHGILGVLFIVVGFYAIWHPYDTFATLAALVGLFLLFRGIFDITVAFVTKDEFELWWLQLIAGIAQILLAFWVAGNWQNKAILLVVYVGIVALMRGITEIFLAFKLKGVRRKLASA